MMRFAIRTIPRPTIAASLLALIVVGSSCGVRSPRSPAMDPSQVGIAQLWIEPSDIETRDLFNGPGRADGALAGKGEFKLLRIDRKGYSPGYEVEAPDGTVWDVKLGSEAQSEVVASRVLWALGYHQPSTYYVPNWVLVDKERTQQPGARFRPNRPDEKVVSDWSWSENEFVDTLPFKGLIVANLIINNWDWKTSNNKIYEGPSEGAPARRYVVRDLGASFGKTSSPGFLRWLSLRGNQGSRNDVEDFESQNLITSVDRDRIKFDYRGIYQPIVDSVGLEHVLWMCRLMARVSDKQWDDAFRAAGYGDDVRQRYVAKLKSKIAEGLTLEAS